MDIPFPIKGLSEFLPKGTQPPLTTQDALNVRPFDPVSGRARGGQRPGTEKDIAAQVSTSPIKRLQRLVYDSRKTAYAVIDPPTVKWSTNRPATTAVRDRQDNLYVVEQGASVVRYNSGGRKVWALKVPVEDSKHVVHALAVDEEGNVYAGVTEGGDQKKARVWRFRTQSIEAPVLVWTLDAESYVRAIRLRGNVIYLALNDEERWRSSIRCYHGAQSSSPTLSWTKDVSYPISYMDLNADGDVYFCSPPFAQRGQNPKIPNTVNLLDPIYTAQIVEPDWDITDLADHEERIWSWFRADKIEGLKERESVDVWEDLSGNGRNLFTSTLATTHTSPVFTKSGIGGRPSVSFRGSTDALISGINSSTNRGAGQQQRTIVPGYRHARWGLFIVFRPALDETVTGSEIPAHVVFSQNLDQTGGLTPGSIGAGDINLWVNADNVDAGSSPHPPQRQSGRIYLHFNANRADVGNHDLYIGSVNPGHGGATWDTTNTHARTVPMSASFSSAFNPSQTVLVTLLWNMGNDIDNASPPYTATDDGSVTHCTLRVNGKPIDRWTSMNYVTARGVPSRVGMGFAGAGSTNFFQGEIAEILCIEGGDGRPQKLLTHPLYPRTVGAIGGALNYQTSAAVSHIPNSDTELERIEGVLMQRWGISHRAPRNVSFAADVSSYENFETSQGNYEHPYHHDLNGVPEAGATYSKAHYMLTTFNSLLAKLDGSKGALKWVYTPGAASDGGGVGHGLSVHTDGTIFSVGAPYGGGNFPPDGSSHAADDVEFRLLQETNGALPTILWAGRVAAGAGNWISWPMRPARDKFGNCYLPINHTDSTSSLWILSRNGDTGGTGHFTLLDVAVPIGPCTWVVTETTTPDYRLGAGVGDDFRADGLGTDPTEYPRARHVWVVTTTGAHKLELVSQTPMGGSPREIKTVAVAGGAINVVGATAAIPAGLGTLAQPELDATADFVDSAVLFGKVYLTDGVRDVLYDPKTDVVGLWHATDGGKVPERTKLLCAWRGRAVKAREESAPHAWYMSELGDPLHWDLFRVPRTSTMAVSAVTARAGDSPDIINALIPYSDDVLCFGCDSSVWVLRGDPMSGGVFDLVSDITGMAFGRSWCKDPYGTIYFFGSRGGVYRWSPGGVPEPLTADRMPKRMQAIDLSTYRVELVWDDVRDGMLLFVLPIVPEGSSYAIDQFWWDRRTDGWWPERLPAIWTPTAVAVADGDDPADRRVLLGCSDGYLRRYADAAKSDDGERITTRVLVGPLVLAELGQRARVAGLNVLLAGNQDGVRAALHASDDPDRLGEAVADLELEPGQNRIRSIRARGAYVWLSLGQTSAVRRWSVEGMGAQAYAAGRTR